MATLESLNDDLLEMVDALKAIQDKAVKLHSRSIQTSAKMLDYANLNALDYENEDAAVDDGVFNRYELSLVVLSKFERISNDIKKLLDYAKP